MNMELAFSPCPNDTFIFHALVQGLIDTSPYNFTPYLADVEELNEKASSGSYGITKLSFAALFNLKSTYTLLDAGSALGFGCGPVLVAKKGLRDIENARVAVPGRHTTAFLLLRLWNSGIRNIEFTRFDTIMPGIAAGRYDAGVVIHEGRFVYSSFGLNLVMDLGAWWEKETGLPIPLGCIAIRNDLIEHAGPVSDMIRASIEFARAHPEASRDFIRSHAQEMDEDVIREHIALYVNDFSLSFAGIAGEAISTLEKRARAGGIL